MQPDSPSTSTVAAPVAALAADTPPALSPSVTATAPGTLRTIKRNGAVVTYDDGKIQIALTKAFLAVEGGTAAASTRIRELVTGLTQQVTNTFQRRMPSGGTIHIEEIQDQVELVLMRSGEHKVARDYVLYREEHARIRAANAPAPTTAAPAAIHVVADDGSRALLDVQRLRTVVEQACRGLADVDAERIIAAALANMYDGIEAKDVTIGLLMTARALVEEEPSYTYVSARLLLDKLRSEALTFLDVKATSTLGGVAQATQDDMANLYAPALAAFVKRGVQLELLAPELMRFDLERLGRALRPERDEMFTYLGLQTLYDRYFIHKNNMRFELPQVFFMRVAMGLAIQENEPEERAIEFYNLLSSFDYMSSTPTLFNAGTLRSQLSSCFLTTVADDLDGIYSAIRDNALLSKWAGGLGNDWTPVRALGAYIKGTNGKSQGVVPFLKVVNDTAVAVNQCFAPDTRVHTADGVKAIRDVTTQDLVLGQRGEYRQVRKTMTYNQTDPMVEVYVTHAVQPLRVTAGHPIWAIQGAPLEQSVSRLAEPRWVEAGQLAAGDYVAQAIPQEVLQVAGFDEDDARFYGILLGEGHCSEDGGDGGDGREWSVSGDPASAAHWRFVAEYLVRKGIHHWTTGHGRYRQIHWGTGIDLVRDGTTGQCLSTDGYSLGPLGPLGPLGLTRDDLHDAQGLKRIHRRFSHLPKAQTLSLLHGLLEASGSVGADGKIRFTNTSEALAEDLRYQLLRLGIPTAGRVRCNGVENIWDIRVPAVPELADKLNCQPLTTRSWLALGNCIFSRVRSAKSLPPLPFVVDLKVEGDESYMTTSALAHNGGKRKGAVCSYLETWHLDIEEFLELRKNTGDDRRRTHDMNTANWVPDLFMKRVFEDGAWTLFSPNEVTDLHDLWGAAFESRYSEYERMTETGEITLFKRVRATELWRKMLSMLFETGHPWITFKDACNERSPQQHIGVVHSSNLCTEITLNTSAEEIAVCNLGSVNLARHVVNGKLDKKKLKKTVRTAVRMLDNVIDINYYSVPQARTSNIRHRPVGLGIMGFQDALFELRIPYASEAAVEFADRSMEALSYYAIEASSKLAQERGSYATFEGSLWSHGILPIDSLKRLAHQRGAEYMDMDASTTMDWKKLRNKVRANGMRNSNVMAIAPTATIANVVGVSQSIEPTYQNLYVKSNLSGEFTVVNPYMVRDLKRLGLWDKVMVNDLKYYDGSLANIDRVPAEVKQLYATAFEVEPRWLVDAASRRQKWIDQAQSLNLYIDNASGKKLDITYRMAWLRGLKTTYYLRALGATSTEKSTLEKIGTLNAVATGGLSSGTSMADNGPVGAAPNDEPTFAAPANLPGAPADLPAAPADLPAAPADLPAACTIDDPDCEACQ